VKAMTNAKHMTLLIAAILLSGIVQAKQFVCTTAITYASEPDGKLKVKEDHSDGGERKMFTVDTATGIVQGDQVLPTGSYTVVYAGTATDGAKLLRNDAARLEVLFIATYAKPPFPFLFTDGEALHTGTCRAST
jgi:hypothetical protein